MKFFRLSVACFLSLILAGCFHIQLRGSVGGGKLSIALLRDAGTVVLTADSLTPEDLVNLWGQEFWDEQASLIRLAFVGITLVETDGVDADALYLATASGGEDFDTQLKFGLSSNPLAVQGNWHAIVSGQHILDGNVKVSALTEALYQQLSARINEWSDAEIVARLNAAAELVVSDIDDDGGVDYEDVLNWNRTFDGAKFLGDLSAVDRLSSAVAAGQPAQMLLSKAMQVLGNHTVVMEFDAGTVTLETLNWDSPITAANFLRYIKEGFYDQVMVHRAIDGFMIQMGYVSYLGRDNEGLIAWELKPAGATIVNESSNGLSNKRGTLSMARTNDPDSASSQFFINQVDNTFLDHGSAGNPDGYTVFATVLSGMEIVDSIAGERTTTVRGIGSDVPVRAVVLESTTLQ
ncbi:MAG: peptidyl-prolyl cis-trans isomerase B (cyclophilin B) [Halioglobus sp.]|jgi:cyclophilin family peptidyl-prolyl cis-trans isomerase